MDNNNPITGAQPQPQPAPDATQPQPQPAPDAAQPANAAQPAFAPQPQPEPQQPAAQPQPTAYTPSSAQPTATNNPQPTMTTNPQPTAFTPNPAAAPSPAQPKTNGKLIAIIAAVAVVVIAVVVTLVIVLLNNSSKTGVDKGNNTGNNHYETDDDEDDDNNTGSPSNVSGSSISCLGYSFTKLDGYSYNCQISGLTVQNSEFATYIEATDGINYYQAENNADALAAAFEEEGIEIYSHRTYTASNNRQMLVYGAYYGGSNLYLYLTPASSSAIMVGQILQQSRTLNNSDLDLAAEIIGASTVSSRLPDETSDGELPEIDWSQYFSTLKSAE